MSFNCETLADMDPQALGLTYWFEAAPEGDSYRVRIRFDGRRAGGRDKDGLPTSFSVLETMDHVVPGSGRIAITTRVHGVAPGAWRVTVTPVEGQRQRGRARGRRSAPRRGLPSGSASGATAYAPVMRVRAPGARIGAWPTLVSVGVAVGVTMQLVLAARAGLSVGAVLAVSLMANLVGLVGAKLYYLGLHREPLRKLATTGMGIQGYVLGAIGTLVAGATVARIPLGQLLDVTAPGLLLAMGIGRLGCFFGGCCAGRLTASRWGLWSSDRHVGARRIPTQLLESALAASVGVAALISLAVDHPAGVVFVGAIAAYTLSRQLLLPLRDLPRKTTRGRTLVMLTAALIIAADVGVAVLG